MAGIRCLKISLKRKGIKHGNVFVYFCINFVKGIIEMTKLYELNKGDSFRLLEDASIPPAAPEGDKNSVYRFNKIDGMYANVFDSKDVVHYFAAWTEIETVA